MEKEILSLKNIYGFLTINDYPVYSNGIIKEDNRKGLTLTRFWQDILLYEFRSGYYGKMIWRITKGRNRHLSEMCNRSEVLKWYPQYSEELILSINENNLLQQINQFMDCLKERKYDSEIFEKKLGALLEIFEEGDSCYTVNVAGFFKKNLAEVTEELKSLDKFRLFYAGWVLTFLSLHAMMGEQMGSSHMQEVRENKNYSLTALWEVYEVSQKQRNETVHFITGRNSALSVTPLQKMHFFGREVELFDLQELVNQNGYYLISGMGGIGKTELLRQLLHWCVEQKLVDEVALIQYEGSLVESLQRAFPDIYAEDDQIVLSEALARIRMHEDKRVLTLVDNMNKSIDEDPALAQLLTLPGTVMITSRQTNLEGFQTYEVDTIELEMGMLIFRDHYQKPLTTEDREALNELMEQEIWRHTLTLKLLGNTARIKNWTVKELNEKLLEGGGQLLKPRESREHSLVEMYRRMYDMSELSAEQIRFLRCFAALPYQSYTREFVETYILSEMESVVQFETLEKLQDYGWISYDESADTYIMHPVVAECILSTPLQEKDVESFLVALEKQWNSKCGAGENDNLKNWYIHAMRQEQADMELAAILLNVEKRLTGNVSDRAVRLLIMVGILHCAVAYPNKIFFDMEKLLQRFVSTDSEEIQLWKDYITISISYSQKKEYYIERWQSIEHSDEIAEWLKPVYGQTLAYSMVGCGDYKEAEQILMHLQKMETLPILQVIVEHTLGKMYEIQTRMDLANKQMDKAVEYAVKYDFPNGAVLSTIYQNKYNICAQLGDIDGMDKCLKVLEKLVNDKETFVGQSAVILCKVHMARIRGELERAQEYLQKLIPIIRNLYGENVEYAMYSSEVAMLLNKQAKYEESEKCFEKVIAVLITVSGHLKETQLHRAYNNMADMYINWNKPQKSLECLEHAEEYGDVVAGIGAAEVKRNLARTYRMLGNAEKEYEYLQIAVPLLTEAYGPEHERTVAMRERWEEVSKN